MENKLGEAAKSRISQYIRTEELNDQMIAILDEYLLSLRVSELSKETYLLKLKLLGSGYFLMDGLSLSKVVG
jgi:hypothetical protein